MSDSEALRLELDDWRDLVASGGWKRLQEAFDAQWGDASVIRTLEQLTPGANTAEEAKRLLQLRVTLREFLAMPAQRVLKLEQQRAKETAATVKPWTKP